MMRDRRAINENYPLKERRRKDYFSLFLCNVLFLYLVTSYFYFFPSGYPQIADFALATGIGFSLLSFLVGRDFSVNQTFVAALVFGAFTFVINMLYFFFLRDFGLILSSLYYVYNAAIFVFVASLFRRAPDMTFKFLYWGLALSIFAQVFLATLFPEYESGRNIGTFNNPNQLADWALFSGCALVILKYRQKLTLFDLFLLLCIGYLQTLALSKASLICYLILIASLPFSRALKTSHRTVFLSVGLVVFIYGIWEFSTLQQHLNAVGQIEQSIERLENIGQEADDNARGRGYLRLIQYPQYLLTGAGEGAYQRFSDFTKPIEIHSGLANLLFSYGILGFMLFLFFLYMVARKTPRYFLVLAFIVMLNGVTHQNIRFSHLWIFFGTAYGVRYTEQLRRKGRRASDREIGQIRPAYHIPEAA